MLTLENKIFLQVGLGSVGQALAKKAVESGMRVYGVDKTTSFKPHCFKQFNYNQLEMVLPEADVVSIALPREQGLQVQFTKELIEKIKNDAILTILGSPRIVDEPVLVEQAPRFRGILIDAYYQNPIPPQSKLWTIPNLLITPEVAPRPKSQTKEAARTFRFNLRQYLHDNYSDMKNLVDPQVAYIPDTEIS